MIQHIVAFKLKGDPLKCRQAAIDFAKAIKALPSHIDCLKAVEAGTNVNPDETWDVALVATLDSLQDVAIYANHPAHMAAASIIAPYKGSRACVDIEI